MHDLIEKLRAPFPPELVSWRVGSTNKRNWSEGKPRRGQVLAYIDARDVMRRLDEVVGPAGWQAEYTPMPNGTTCCRLGILLPTTYAQDPHKMEWVWKSNGAGATDVEGEKGAYSDAFKRAAVLWGIGQYLYDIKSPWIVLTEYWSIPDSELPALHRLLSGEKEPSAHGARGTGDFERLEKGLRSCKTMKALATFWNTNQKAIGAMPAGWRDALMAEKDRCKDTLQQAEAA